MSQTRLTRGELEEENAALRGRLAEARDLIDDALGVDDVDDIDEDDENGDDEGDDD